MEYIIIGAVAQVLIVVTVNIDKLTSWAINRGLL